ncbi:hypothetical protein DEAC_c14690 [Desulfosporosinus acididurans]|uniref:YetF C-terminal domain-containing protein n=2 Tax=Desulfosporosinus acididurans TaxID=476652 RepID=A0A0J1IQ34_9FIRM|nr:hypothetical protein DEAC_c14690 [Desulfosporosinus acididurans]
MLSIPCKKLHKVKHVTQGRTPIKSMILLWGLLSISTIVTFLVLLILVRFIGSTQLTQLTFFNWVAGAAMGNLAANMIAARTIQDWFFSCYTLILFAIVSVLAAILALKYRLFRRIANGEPIVLIRKGIMFRKNLRKTKVNLDVLMMLLREKGYFSYSDIEYAILEPTGNLSILPKQEYQSVSKIDLVEGPDLSPEGQGPFVEIIVDGEIDHDKLKSTKHDEAWIQEQINKIGANSFEDVLYLAVNSQGEVIADLHRRGNISTP